jgi:hypothetical protein
MAYAASEDPVKFPRDKSILPINTKTGTPGNWPEKKAPKRHGRDEDQPVKTSGSK